MKFIFTFVAIIFTANIYTDIIGKAEIVDGDTIIINDIRIRFTGSDAPESYFLVRLKNVQMHKAKNGNVEKLQQRNSNN